METPRLEGRWRVRREAGLLPPFVKKKISDGGGWTYWFGLPVGRFVRDGATLRYRLWPIRDELRAGPDGFHGRGLLFGREFCRFRLDPL